MNGPGRRTPPDSPGGSHNTVVTERIVTVWHDRFDDSKTTGLQSDAYWIGIFLGIVLAFVVTFTPAFFLLSGDILIELLPFVFIAALVLSYLLARVLARTLSAFVARRFPSEPPNR